MSDALPDMLTRLRSSHAARTLDLGTLLLWSNHVAVVVAVLQEAAQDLRDPGILSPFQKPGWWRRAKRRNANGSPVKVPEEDAISHALVERIKCLQAAPRPGSVFASNFDLAVFRQVTRRRQAGTGPKGRKNTDLVFYKTGEIHLDLRLETKIVFDVGDLQREYCSENGLLRYSDPNNPYTTEILGGMVAYCVTRNSEDWTVQIENRLHVIPCVSGVGRVSLGKQMQSLLCCEIMKVGESTSSVVVFHLGLEFDTDPPSRP